MRRTKAQNQCPSVADSVLLTVRREQQRRDQQQRVGDAVRWQQLSQLGQDEPAQVAVCPVCLLLRRWGQLRVLSPLVHGVVSGRDDKGEQSKAFV